MTSIRALTTLALVASAGALAFGAAASAQSKSEFGESSARSCYENALMRRDGRNELNQCDKALHDDPLSQRDRAATLVNRGILNKNRGDFDKAMADFDDALKIDHDLGEAYVNIGWVYIEQRDWRSALTNFERGLSLDINSRHRALYGRAIAREELGDLEGAYEDLNAALELAPEWGPAKRRLERFQIMGLTRGA